MRPVSFFTLMVTSIVALLAMFQIQLVQDVVTSTGYAPSEVEAGIIGIIFVFYTLIGVFTVR